LTVNLFPKFRFKNPCITFFELPIHKQISRGENSTCPVATADVITATVSNMTARNLDSAKLCTIIVHSLPENAVIATL